MRYEKFDILEPAKLALNYLTSMVDKKKDYLPYWLIAPQVAPAYAKHCRVDDAELVASWYEAIHCVREMLNTKEGKEVEEGFQRHLMKSWGKEGLRYHEDYPWSVCNHSSFHEMGYVLSALNRWLIAEPDNKEVEKRAAGLVKGMRNLVYERKIRTFWSGDFPYEEKIYEFPSDIYIRDKGWDFTRVTGRGEESIRNAVNLLPLVVRWEKFGDEVALDLAEGLANHLLTISRYFNYKGEFFGHVHSSIWVAAALVRLGRLRKNDWYKEKGKQIFEYVLSLSSDFGWVPEYAQWHPMSQEHCETCCIKDMIECALELIDAGENYWDVVNQYTRNQLVEQQVRDGSFVAADNSLEDTEDTTYRDIDKRIAGGWSGGGEPNSVSLQRFRSIAGCCVGTAPQALYLVWQRIVEKKPEGIYINLPIEIENNLASVKIGYPNEGWMKVTAKKAGDYLIRPYKWMGEKIELQVNGKNLPFTWKNDCIFLEKLQASSTISISHRLEEVTKEYVLRDCKFQAKWRGPDVVDIQPPGLPLRLYQRQEGVEKEVPPPPSIAASKSPEAMPTEQTK